MRAPSAWRSPSSSEPQRYTYLHDRDDSRVVGAFEDTIAGCVRVSWLRQASQATGLSGRPRAARALVYGRLHFSRTQFTKLCPDIRTFPDTIHWFTKPVPRLPVRPRPSTDICKPAPIASLYGLLCSHHWPLAARTNGCALAQRQAVQPLLC